MGTNRPQKLSIRSQLIRELQSHEGHEPCYATSKVEHCNAQEQCRWHHDCLHEAEGNSGESPLNKLED